MAFHFSSFFRVSKWGRIFTFDILFYTSTLLLSSILFITLAGSDFGVTQVVGRLQVHPEFCRRLKNVTRRDASFIFQNRRDPVGRLRERVCRQTERVSKTLR
jgi:hypothetical protein